MDKEKTDSESGKKQTPPKLKFGEGITMKVKEEVNKNKKKSEQGFQGGHEMYNLPSPRMKETYRFFVDAGADTVIGHHTHCISGYEIYHKSPIFYSLGNFIFDSKSPKKSSWFIGFAVCFKLSQNTKVSFDIIPFEQCHQQAGIRVLNGQIKDSVLNDIEKYSAIIQDNNTLQKQLNNFINGR